MPEYRSLDLGQVQVHQHNVRWHFGLPSFQAQRPGAGHADDFQPAVGLKPASEPVSQQHRPVRSGGDGWRSRLGAIGQVFDDQKGLRKIKDQTGYPLPWRVQTHPSCRKLCLETQLSCRLAKTSSMGFRVSNWDDLRIRTNVLCQTIAKAASTVTETFSWPTGTWVGAASAA